MLFYEASHSFKKELQWINYVAVDYVVRNLSELILNMIPIRGEEHASLPKYLEDSDYRYEGLNEAGVEIANINFRNVCILKMDNRGQSSF